MSLVRDEPDKPPYVKYMGDIILEDGYIFLDGEKYIWNLMDEAAEKQDWKTYQDLMRDYAQLEDNYL